MFISDTISTDPKQFAIKTIFIHYILYKEIKQIVCKKSNAVIVISASILSIILITIHLNDINSIVNNGELLFLINLSLSSLNIYVILYWVIVLTMFFIGQSMFHNFIRNKMKPIIQRKLFHFLICLVYIPSVKHMNKDLLITISLIVLYFFIAIEKIRNIKVKSFQDTQAIQAINKYLKNNIDNRDDSKFIITHIFLLTGVMSSLFYSFHGSFNSEYVFISIIVLGVGDAFCSIVGVYYGKTMIYYPTKRTLEGSIAGLISAITLFLLISQRQMKLSEGIAFCLIFLYEGITLEIDNLVLPLFSNLLFVYISIY